MTKTLCFPVSRHVLRRAALLALLGAGGLLAEPTNLRADASLFFQMPGTTVTAGSMFNVTLQLSITPTGNPTNAFGVDFFLGATSPGGNFITLTQIDRSATVFNDFATDNATVAAALPRTLATAFDTNLGGLEPNLTPQGAGVYSLATFSFSVDAATPAGNYLITTGTGGNAATVDYLSGSGDFLQAPIGPATFDLQVTGVPEVASGLWVGAVGLTVALWQCWRGYPKRRARHNPLQCPSA